MRTSTKAVTIRKNLEVERSAPNEFGLSSSEFEAPGGYCPAPSVRTEALIPPGGLGIGG